MTTEQYLERLKELDKCARNNHIRFLILAVVSFGAIVFAGNCRMDPPRWLIVIPIVFGLLAMVPWKIVLRPWIVRD